MRQIILLAFVASFALAQSKTPAPAARDGGVTLVRPSAVDAGVPAAQVVSAPSPELEKLRKEVLDLKLRTAELERQLLAKSASSDLEKLNAKIDALTEKLTKVSEAEERRSDAEEAVATKKANTAAASSNLNAVLLQLVSGNTKDIDPSLRYAESVYTGNAQKDVQLARAAIAQGDVSAARQYLMLALWELENQR
jgi:predicted  nucleic acid-binding Zn-ribbon protein